MKVFVNQEGELAIGVYHYPWLHQWSLDNGHEEIVTYAHPSEWGWEYLGELD